MDALPIDRICAVEYYVQGADENRVDSCVNVVNKDIFRNDLPTPGGIYDAHMGTTDFAWNCETCGNTKQYCPGHPGALTLRYPVKNPLYRDQLLRWLKTICFNCGRIASKKKLVVPQGKLLPEYARLNVSKCDWCGTAKHNVQRAKHEHNKFFIETTDMRGTVRAAELFNHEIAQILERISVDTVRRLGKKPASHPRKFILDTIRVPPNVIRPDIRHIGGSRSPSNDITVFLKNIVEINDSLPDEIPDTNRITIALRDKYYMLDMTFSDLVRGSSTSGNQVHFVTLSNKAPGSLYERFRGKEGRLQRNMLGKRVFVMSRSVLSGNDLIKIDEFIIPMSTAQTISIPETVRPFNRERLNLYYLNGRNAYPGCTGIVKKSTGSFYRIERLGANYVLQEGDTVYRNVVNGDVINCNRQPTLEFCGITAMRAVVLNGVKTHSINAAATKFFNADFDGDEMNVIFPQNIMARNEIAQLASPAAWFVSYKDSAPKLGCVHDAIIGMSEITRHNVVMDKYHAMQMFSSIPHVLPNGKLLRFKAATYTGRDIISMVLPLINLTNARPSIYMPQYAAVMRYNPEDVLIQIDAGRLKSGVLDKSTIGSGNRGSLFHIINNEYGPRVAMDTIYTFQQLASRYFIFTGYTAGLNDIKLSDFTMRTIKRNTEAMIVESRRITDRMQRGELVPPLGITIRDFYDREQINALMPGDEFIVPVLSDLDTNKNSFLKLVLSGAKGNITNLVQTNVALGLQLIAGKLADRNFGWERTSPYFQRYETEPKSRGYIPTSFKEGTEPDVFPFAAAEGRYGILNIALSTSVTGYINKLCVRNMESMISNNRYGIMNGANIAQLLYAESGFDPRFLEIVSFPTIMISDRKFDEMFHTVAQGNAAAHIQKHLDDEFHQLAADRNAYREIFMKLEDSFTGSVLIGGSQLMPVNIQRIVDDLGRRTSAAAHPKIDYVRCIERVRRFMETLPYVYYNHRQKELKGPVAPYYDKALTLLRILARSYLCTSYLARSGLNESMLDVAIEKIERVLARALIDPGKAIGIIAAQCICEPMMQYMLDSKHRTGGGGSTKLNAVTRCREILTVQSTKDMKAPSMLIRLKPADEKNSVKAKEIANHIEVMHFKKFIIKTHIFFERYGHIVHPAFKHEQEMLKTHETLNRGSRVPSDLAHWCIRFELDRERLIFNAMKLETIIMALRQSVPHVHVVYTPETSEHLIIRCYPRMLAFKNNIVDEPDITKFMHMIKGIVVRGVGAITSATVVTIAKSYLAADGSVAIDKIYAINTDGTNMEAIMASEYVDPYRTQSNSVTEIEQMFGIAAARDKIIYELVHELTSLSKSLCTLLADELTLTGTVTGIQMSGMHAREPKNISLRMALQSPVQIVGNAAVDNVTEVLSGVSGPLLMGSVPRIGTLYNRVVLSTDFLQKSRRDVEANIEEML